MCNSSVPVLPEERPFGAEAQGRRNAIARSVIQIKMVTLFHIICDKTHTRLPPWLPLFENIIETPHTTTIVKSGQKLLITLKSSSGAVTCSQPSPVSEKIWRHVNEPGTDRTQGRDVRVAHLWQRRKGKTGPPHNQSCKGLSFMQILDTALSPNHHTTNETQGKRCWRMLKTCSIETLDSSSLSSNITVWSRFGRQGILISILQIILEIR